MLLKITKTTLTIVDNVVFVIKQLFPLSNC
jgi:hypothetical protein